MVVSRLGLGMAALGRPGYINLHHGQDLGHESGEAAMEDLLEPSAGPGLLEAQAAGLGVIVKEALANRTSSRTITIEERKR